jgi:hypothetical protein
MKAFAKTLVIYMLTSAIVFTGLHFGARLLKPNPHGGHIFDPEAGPFANWDGQWYSEIASRGYSYGTGGYSSVAFFPAYPFVGRMFAFATGLPIDIALLLTSNCFFLGALWMLAAYIRRRDTIPNVRLEDYTLLILAAAPSSFFFRMAYSESMFLFVTVLFLTAMERRWPLASIAALVGLATAIRPVGVGLIPPLLLHAWLIGGTTARRTINIALSATLSVWGLASYSIYLFYKFGDPLAFLGAQAAWNRRMPESSVNRALELLSLGPVWSIFDPESIGYWYTHDIHHSFIFSLRPYDAGFFLLAIGLTFVGAVKGWLSGREVLTSACLLLIPYCTNGYATYMNSMGRYSAAAVPIYLVMGRALKSLPEPFAVSLVGLSCFFLGTYAALFAAWYVVI